MISWRILKAPPLKSLVLHFLVFQNRPNRGPLICSKICLKKLSSSTGDVRLLSIVSTLPFHFNAYGQTSVLYRSNLFSNILYAPKIAKLGFFKFMTDIVIIGLTMTFYYRKCRSKDLRGGAFSIHQFHACR